MAGENSFVRIGKRIIIGLTAPSDTFGLRVASGSTADATTAGYLRSKVFVHNGGTDTVYLPVFS